MGQSVSIDAEAYQVVGVLPRGTTWLGLDAYEPLVLSPERSRSDHRWQVVARLRKELGVRIALGASGGEVVALVMRQGMVPAVLGIGAGLVATMGVSRASGSLLYGVSATDPLTYLGRRIAARGGGDDRLLDSGARHAENGGVERLAGGVVAVVAGRWALSRPV